MRLECEAGASTIVIAPLTFHVRGAILARGQGVDAISRYFLVAPSVISNRRPRVTCSGGAGMVISSTPSLNDAFA
jgi:hypothetical protein